MLSGIGQYVCIDHISSEKSRYRRKFHESTVQIVNFVSNHNRDLGGLRK